MRIRALARLKQPFWYMAMIIGLAFLAACSTQTAPPSGESSNGTTGGAIAVDTDADSMTSEEQAESDIAEEESAESTMEEESAQPESANTDKDIEILTEDNRPAQLASLTATWNTNWNRRIIEYEEILSGGPPRDGIPSIDEPTFIDPEEATAWLAGNEPVVAIEFNGDARAYPIQILTWHEIVNDTVGGEPVVVTFCPLCNAAIVFDRTLDGEVVEFGTSGLLRNSDLIMYDRLTESLWQQFTGEAIVGDAVGTQLTFLPSTLISFDDFRAAYPDGVVLSRETGFNRRYGQNPYVGYDTIGSNPFLFDGVVDGRLPAVERVVAVMAEEIGVDVAYPYSIISEIGAVNDTQNGRDLVVFHVGGTSSALGAARIADGEDIGAAAVYDPIVDGQLLTFGREGSNFVDAETGSTWNILGEAVEGPLAGQRLNPVVHGNHFWFSWAAFRPDTVLFQS